MFSCQTGVPSQSRRSQAKPVFPGNSQVKPGQTRLTRPNRCFQGIPRPNPSSQGKPVFLGHSQPKPGFLGQKRCSQAKGQTRFPRQPRCSRPSRRFEAKPGFPEHSRLNQAAIWRPNRCSKEISTSNPSQDISRLNPSSQAKPVFPGQTGVYRPSRCSQGISMLNQCSWGNPGQTSVPWAFPG